jgi:phosphate-selective porin OprO and OprP
VAARFTGLPWYADGGCQLVHLGMGYQHLFRSNDTANFNGYDYAMRFQSKPEWNFGPATLNTGLLYGSSADILNPEAAFVYGPFSMQGEYMIAYVNDAAASATATTHYSPTYDGYYIMASYFLTGEHRAYDLGSGTFGRPDLNCNFDLNAGTWGALELAARYSSANFLDDSLPASARLQGGEEQNWTGSLVWYLNPNVRVLFDYVHAHVNGYQNGGKAPIFVHNGDANIFDARFQVFFF